MKPALLLCAALLLAVPATAEFLPSIPKNLPVEGGTTGVYLGPGMLASYTVPIYANHTDYIVVPFAFHWPSNPYACRQVQFGLQYDNTEVEILGIQPIGMFAGGANGFAGATFPNPTSGTIIVTGGLFADPVNTTATCLFNTSVYPLFQVTVHVKNVIADGLPDIVMTSNCGVLMSHIATGSFPPYTSYWWSLNVGAPNWGASIVPEPASLGLLGIAALAIGGGIWRRRR